MKSTDPKIKEKLRQLGLVYADIRLSDEDLVSYADLAWQEVYELEYEQAFGGWRGVHLDEKNDCVNITFDNAYGGPPLMVKVTRETKERKFDYPPDEYIRLENMNISKIMMAMGMPEEQAEKYRSMYVPESEERP